VSATGPPSAPGLLPVTGTARSDLVSPRQTLRVRLSHSGVFEPRYLGSRDIPNSTCRYGAVVGAVGATNVTVTGGGIIDGQGWHFWDLVDKNHQTPGTLNCSRPHLVEFERCTDVAIVGASDDEPLTLQNSPFWTSHFIYSKRCHASNLKIFAPATRGNTDGVFKFAQSMLRLT
jgi:polygalacturonase